MPEKSKRRGLIKWAGVALALVGAFLAGRVAPRGAVFPPDPKLVDANGDAILPRPEKAFGGIIGATPDQSRQELPQRVKAPDGAPNVLVVLTDDVGFGASSTFGGPIPTPNLDALAARGVILSRFHTTAMCSPTRAALLTGRNAHRVGSAVVTEVASGYPGYNSVMPRSAATLGRTLTGNGYNTAFFGKHHNTPLWEVSSAGPFDRWPTGLGFEYFYGFLGGDTDQFNPVLYRGTNRVDLSNKPADYILDRDMADDAIHWLRTQNTAAPAKPFYIHYAPGTAHAPHQAPMDWIEKFRGKFSGGWNRAREETLARQIKLGIVPEGTKLAPWPKDVPTWDSLTLRQKQIAERFMETQAAALAYQDAQFGRIVAEIESQGELDNTLILFIQGDNGASAEGGLTGTVNEIGRLANGVKESEDWLDAARPEMGGPRSYQTGPVGWALAMNTPFPWTKQVASHLGGSRNGLVASWPAQIRERGGLRNQFHHVVDVFPTVLEAAKLPAPTIVDGVRQMSVDGVSMLPTLRDARAPEVRKQQYFEIMGYRALYRDGFLASATPLNGPWVSDGASTKSGPEQAWELYDLRTDFSQSKNIASLDPKRLAEMRAAFDAEAKSNNVYPLNPSRGLSRFEALIYRAGAAGYYRQKRGYTYSGQNFSVTQSDAPPLFARDFVIDANVTIPKGGAEGALIGYGSWFGGWSFYVDKGRPAVRHAFSQQPQDQFSIVAPTALPPGKARLRFKFDYDGGGVGKGGAMRIFVNDKEVARGRIDRQVTMVAGITETFDLGADTGAPVLNYAGGRDRFNGSIERIDVKPEAIKILPF